ncbi:UbiA prenyltransferase family-domain-containing protein [Xylariomycetidae sp. FL0641]|nr:UbiA prenyltransferase family-domain-containing protein [Xylariomycetidae sp. FL0641]
MLESKKGTAEGRVHTPLLEKCPPQSELMAATETSEYSSKSLVGKIAYIPHLIWVISESDFDTFVIPNTAFGVLGAFAAPVLASGFDTAPTALDILSRLSLVAVFNWYMVLVFELANQRSPASVREDCLNKPHRAIPSGQVTSDEMRRALLCLVPLAALFNHALDVTVPGLGILVLTWVYNDLGGGDGLGRDTVIAAAYALFNSASLLIALGPGAQQLSCGGIAWTAFVSAVILTTMQVQDLKDMAGDAARGRRTIPLAFGENLSRTSIAAFVTFWSVVAVCFWRPESAVVAAVPAVPGLITAVRVVLCRTPRADANTWRIWCLWTVALYLLPVLCAVVAK